MLKITMPLANANPCLTPKAKLLVEVAAIYQRTSPRTYISWDIFVLEFPYLTKEGEKLLVLQIPKGEYIIPRGCSRHTIIRYETELAPDLREAVPYPPEVIVFNKLCGSVQIDQNNTPLLFKWRFIVRHEREEIISPWSYCYQGKKTGPALEPVVEAMPRPEKNEQPAAETKTAVLCLHNRCLGDIFTVGANLGFTFGLANKGHSNSQYLTLLSVIKPTPGVEMQIISMEEVYLAEPFSQLISAEKPGVLVSEPRIIAPGQEISYYIVAKLLRAPVGISFLENKISLLDDSNQEIQADKCTVCLNISPEPDKGAAQCKMLDSIAREEVGLAHLLYSEADRITKASALASDISGLITVGECAQDTLKKLIKYHILLEEKLEDILKIEPK